MVTSVEIWTALPHIGSSRFTCKDGRTGLTPMLFRLIDSEVQVVRARLAVLLCRKVDHGNDNIQRSRIYADSGCDSGSGKLSEPHGAPRVSSHGKRRGAKFLSRATRGRGKLCTWNRKQTKEKNTTPSSRL